MPSALRQAGVEVTDFGSKTTKLTELTGLAMVRLHRQAVPADNPGRFALPENTGQIRGKDPAILCLRPDEWMLISQTMPAADLVREVSDGLGNDNTAITDNSDGLAAFRLSGSGGPWLLSKLSGLDFIAGADSGEHCASTKMGHMAVVIHFHRDEEGSFVFDLLFDRSLARYLWELLLASAPHADDLAGAYGLLHRVSENGNRTIDLKD